MSDPITWRNVGGGVRAPNLNGVSNSMAQAQQSFNSAFAGAGDLLKKRQAIETANQENLVANNTDQFKQMLAQRFSSPEALAQAQQDGTIQAMRDEYGQYGLDTERTNADAITGRLTKLRTQENAEYDYNQTKLDRAEDPIVGQFNSRLNSIRAGKGAGDKFDAVRADLQARVESGDLRPTTAANILAQADTRQNSLTNRYRDDIKWNRNEQELAQTKQVNTLLNEAVANYDPTNPEQRATAQREAFRKKLPANLSSAQREEAIQAFDRRTANMGQIASADQRYVDAAEAQIISDNNLQTNVFQNNNLEQANANVTAIRDKYTRTNEDGQPQFLGVSDSDKRTRAINGLRRLGTEGVDLLGNGQNVPVPTEVLDDVVAGLEDEGWVFNSVDDLETKVKEALNNETYVNQYNNYVQGKRQLREVRNGAFQAMMSNRIGGGSSNAPAATTEQQPTPEQVDSVQPSPGMDLAARLRETPGASRRNPREVAAALSTRPEGQGPATPEQVSQPRENLLGFIEPGSPIGRTAYELGDWFNQTLDQNQTETLAKSQERLTELANNSTRKLSQNEFINFMTRNGMAIDQLPAKELNKLRDIYGQSLVNRFIDPR